MNEDVRMALDQIRELERMVRRVCERTGHGPLDLDHFCSDCLMWVEEEHTPEEEAMLAELFDVLPPLQHGEEKGARQKAAPWPPGRSGDVEEGP